MTRPDGTLWATRLNTVYDLRDGYRHVRVTSTATEYGFVYDESRLSKLVYLQGSDTVLVNS